MIPYDGVARREIVTVHPALTAVYTVLACAGIVFAIACLIFNYVYRNAKYVTAWGEEVKFWGQGGCQSALIPLLLLAVLGVPCIERLFLLEVPLNQGITPVRDNMLVRYLPY